MRSVERHIIDETEIYISQLKASTPGSTTHNHNTNNNVTHGLIPSSSSPTSYHSSDWQGLASTSANADQQDAQTSLSSSASDQQTAPSATTSGDGVGGSSSNRSSRNVTSNTNGSTSSASADLFFPHNPTRGFQDPRPTSSQPIPTFPPLAFPVTGDEPMNLDFYAPPAHDDSLNANAFSFPQPAAPAAITLLAPLTTFASTLLNTQAEAAVIAVVVADYIAWLRTSPLVAGLADQAPVFLGMLATLEDRLRELVDLQSHGSDIAVRDLGAVLRDMGMGSCVEGLEDRLLGEARQRGKAFRARYNPCALLSEQN